MFRTASLAIIVTLSLSGRHGVAQTDPAEPPPTVESAPTLDPYDPDRVSLDELRLRLLPLRRAELETEVAGWLDRVREQVGAVVAARLAVDAAADADERGRLESRATGLSDQANRVIERAGVAIDALEDKGGEVEEYKRYLAPLRLLVAAPARETDQDLEAVVSQLAPYHALEVGLDELRLRYRRLRRAGLEEEVELWMKRLQQKAGEIAAVEIAARRVQGVDQERLIEFVTRLKEERSRLVERAQFAVDMLEIRGGEVDEFRAYVKAVSGGMAEGLADLSVTDVGAIGVAWNSLQEWAKSKEGGLKIAKNVGMAVLVLLAFWLLGRILATAVSHALDHFKGTGRLLHAFLVGMVRRTVLLIGMVVAVSTLGVNIGPLVAAIGAAGLVLGFALQGTLSNFASGIMILLYRPFDEGDAVEVAGVSGKVETMTMVSTTINTFDNRKVIVPNNSVWNNVITNITGKNTRRVDMQFGISYEDDVDAARELLQEIVTAHPLVLADPKPVIRLHALGESSVDFICRPWAATADYWEVFWDVTSEVKRRFDAAGISIPFPQREIHVRHLDAPASG